MTEFVEWRTLLAIAGIIGAIILMLAIVSGLHGKPGDYT